MQQKTLSRLERYLHIAYIVFPASKNPAIYDIFFHFQLIFFAWLLSKPALREGNEIPVKFAGFQFFQCSAYIVQIQHLLAA